MMKQLKEEYEIESEIGSGGMASVYKAIQKSLGRPVAIKELKRTFHADNQIVQRFEREAKLAASFQHENIVHIYDYWNKPSFCIVMEYVDGTDLADVLDKTGPLPVDVGTMIAIQVCNALDYAHMRGLIHRDIKPSNIMIRRNGEVKLMDFGIAQVRDLKPLTLPGTLLGTPSYMSPEQVMGQPLDNRTDIFSFGIVLYEMFTGVKPFQDEDTRSVSAKILEDKFLSPRSINSDIPRGLQRIIKKCLKKKPHKRYEYVQELAMALGRKIAGKTDKSASLKRISDYLVSKGVFGAVPESETIVLTRKSYGIGTFSKIIYTATAVLVLLMGAMGYYSWLKAKRAAAPADLPQAAPPAAAANLMPAPQPAAPAPAAVEQKSEQPPVEQKKHTARKKLKRKKNSQQR